MTLDHAAFADWDAAYVLGALTPADRRAFEAHLEECERCRVAVGELAAIPGLLAAAHPEFEGVAAVGSAPRADLVDLVIARRRRERRGLRIRITIGVAAAAAVITALVIPVVVSLSPPASTTVALAPVEDSTMTATVELTSVAWGTRIALECGYPGGGWADDDGPWRYVLVVVDETGESSQVSTWTAVPGEVIHLDAATAVSLDEIAKIEVRTPSGVPILSRAIEG